MKHNSKRIKQYAGLAAAFIGAASASEAAVIYTDVDPDVTFSDGTFSVDFDGDGITDADLQQFGFSSPYKGTFESGFGFAPDGGFLSSGYSAGAFSAGVTVGSSGTFNSFGGFGFASFGPFGSFAYGNWPGESDKYLGVEFEISGNTHYGWIRMSMGALAESLTIHSYAYQDVAGASILTGEGEGTTPTCDPPTGLTSMIVNPTKVEVSWNPVAGADFYRLQGRPLGAPGFASIVVPAAFTSREVGGLTPGTTYEWKMQARCPDGMGGFIVSAETALETFSTPSPKTAAVAEIYAYDHTLVVRAGDITAEVVLTDISGRQVSAWQGVSGLQQLALDKALKGTFIVTLQSESHVESKQIVLH